MCKRVQTGTNGCVWVRTGASGDRGHGGYKNKASGGIYGRAGQDLGPMAGEFSPDIMFWAVW